MAAVNIGVDIKFIADQRKHYNAIMSLLVRLISRTPWRHGAVRSAERIRFFFLLYFFFSSQNRPIECTRSIRRMIVHLNREHHVSAPSDCAQRRGETRRDVFLLTRTRLEIQFFVAHWRSTKCFTLYARETQRLPESRQIPNVFFSTLTYVVFTDCTRCDTEYVDTSKSESWSSRS